jgi:hypothetical protein
MIAHHPLFLLWINWVRSVLTSSASQLPVAAPELLGRSVSCRGFRFPVSFVVIKLSSALRRMVLEKPSLWGMYGFRPYSVRTNFVLQD